MLVSTGGGNLVALPELAARAALHGETEATTNATTTTLEKFTFLPIGVLPVWGR
ncbi:MAG: hypothetical protein ACE5JO_00545 [Candidatus Binatia bacterium]